MEKEVVIKVTRLRRRLSVEGDDVKSPSTQSTPTKKRGGRLAAKPQLELIDENVPEAVPKRTRKSAVKEVADPVEKKAVTPSRRSSRISSNTSIVSETPGDMAEDKGTPSRRSTRIKSNTSLIADPVNVNSPRAKRAARRNSQIGSDNETPITPARQTRRTRKDSTSSIDKPVEPIAGKLDDPIIVVIVEESENNIKETKTTESSMSESPSLKKSPELVDKTSRMSSSLVNDNKENEPRMEFDKETSETTAADKSVSESKAEQTNEVVDQKASEQINLSATSKNLIQKLDEAPKKIKSTFNKSTTAVEEPQIKTKRNRTKSWTTISVESSNENSFCSDSETIKKRNKKKKDTLNFSNISGFGDGIMNLNNKKDEENKDLKNVRQYSSTLYIKKKKQHEMSMTVEIESLHEIPVSNTSVNRSAAELSEAEKKSKVISEDVNNLNTSNKHDNSATQKLFEQAPSGVVQSLVFIDDSDSNHTSNGKENNEKSFDNGDQCVPVVDYQLGQDETSKEPETNLSYEPMDIDETIPENVSITNFVDKNDSLSLKEKESENSKAILSISQDKNDSINKSKTNVSNMGLESSINEESDKSTRKSSMSEMINNDVGDNNKSNRNANANAPEDTTDSILHVSNRKSLVDDVNNYDDSINKKSNKSKRKSSTSNFVTEGNTDKDPNNSARKSLNADKSNDESMNEESNKSKRKSSISNLVDENKKEISNKSTKKSSISDLANDENMNKSLNKSKKKSVTSMVVEISMDKMKTLGLDGDCDIINKNSNKSKRTSSISNMLNNESLDTNSDKSKNKSALYLDNTENDSKSTLVLSQLKNVSENEINLESNGPRDESVVNVPNTNTEEESNKKNISLTYSTSTPIQQKSMNKLGLQLNSSIIAPNSANKTEKKDTVNRSTKETSIISEEDDSDSSEEEEDAEEDSEDESSLKKGKLIDDEVEEASDDYESGDSRDEDEREYEKQNELVEKGETLDSEEHEYTDDSDYEKDSFIVSSDEEDEKLLSGSGDDLSLSADELSMTAKSKKKFNERKIKEQKKASREMYEARHKLNESDKSVKSPNSKSKQNNRQRFDTSSSESDEEVITQPKKNRRQRIDSSQDISTSQLDIDKSLSKKKKAKRLSESVCDENETNEKEITISEENQTDKIDPLMFSVIKEEPKTPQKELNISTVAVTNMVEVEGINVDENISIIKSNQTSDPLQATIAENDEEDDTDEGSISENEEITQNYESILNQLNKSGSKKIKDSNISLDLNKKTKQKDKEPIIDQLNLTQVKKSKKKKGEASENTAETKKLDKSLSNKSTDKADKQDNALSEGSSDCIDMKLLFPEESSDSEVVLDIKKQNVKDSTESEDVDEAHGDFIPLKRSQGKTNMLDNIEICNNSKDESILNVSGKKKNKRKSSHTEGILAMSTPEDDNLDFFIDTTGTHAVKIKADANTSIKNSAKKNKQKNNISVTNIEEATVDDNSNDAPLEVSYRREKNNSGQDLNMTQNNEVIQSDNATVETPNQSAKKKKKIKKGLNSSQNVAEISMLENSDVAEKSVNISITNEEGSAKMKKKRQSESQIEHETENGAPTKPVLNVSLGSAKKQKQKTISESSGVETKNVNKDNEVEINQEQITKKRKRKSSSNQTIDEIVIKDDVTKVQSITTINQKKKQKISNNDEDIKTQIEDSVTETQAQEKAPIQNTKKKSKALQPQKVDEIDDEATKKNKKRKERDDDDAKKISKVLKQNSFDKVHVPRLPTNVLKHLEDKPKKEIVEVKKTKVVSTSSFIVEETKRRRNKPSNYLEESVYCTNDDLEEKKQKRSLKNPKVLPFLPTASTSDSGFTTNFRVNVVSQQTQFVAQSSDIYNFKNDYLLKKRIKKLGTFEMYKKQRNIKIAKF